MDTDETFERKLAAILYADVAGYSRLTGEDEEGTHRRLSAYLDLISDAIESYNGRVVHYAGDAVLADFPTVTDALTCAARIQQSLKEKNHDLPAERKVEFRIGVNLGEVIIDRDDIYGGGVNVAARLESLAESGGVCISESVHTAVGNKLPLDYEDLGEQEVKNITNPVRAYNVRLQDGAELPEPKTVSRPKKGPRKTTGSRRSKLALAAVAAAVVGGGLLAWVLPDAPTFEPASVPHMEHPLPDRPSIAVLHFENNSDDAKLDYFADGLTEDLTASLARAPGLFVIDPHSTAAYKGEHPTMKQVAEELAVQFVLEGSVRKSGDTLRVTTLLVDTLSGEHLWSERFDRKASDLFAVQDEITKRVVVELQGELTEGDHARVAARGTDNLDAWLLWVEGHSELIKWTREGIARARHLFQQAHEEDGNWAHPLAGIALTYWYEAKQGWSTDREESIQLGIEFAERAIDVDPDDPDGYDALGNLFFLLHQPDRAIELKQKAIDLAPNDFGPVAGLAVRLTEFGQEQRAIELFEHAMRLSPKHPWWVAAGYGMALHLAGRKDKALQMYKDAVALNPNHARIYAHLAAVYADLGRLDEAKLAVAEALEHDSTLSASSYLKSHPFHDSERTAWYKDLLLRAGLPEHSRDAPADTSSG